MAHIYLSTACLHEAEARASGDEDGAAGLHDYCESMTGLQGAKRPGTCKFCDAACICPHHDEPTAVLR